jgi:hypothetical protein
MADNKLDQAINKGIRSAKDTLTEKMVQLAHKDGEDVKQETVYNVVFTGVFTKDEKMVVAAMAKFFKQGQEATKRLLKAGRVVKSYDNKMAADKLVKMLNGIGLTCKVESEMLGDTKEASLLQKAAFKLDETEVPLVRIPKASEISWKQWLVVALVLAGMAGTVAWMVLKAPTVEGDSFATYETSVQKVIDYEPAEKRAAVKTAVDFLTGAEFEYRKRNTTGGNEQVAANMAYGRLSGMNAKEIIAAAEVALEVKRRGYRDEIERLRKEVAAENATMAELDLANVELKKLEISGLRFAWSQGDAPEMLLSVTNRSGETIARLYFQGYLYDAKGKLLATAPFSFGTAFGIRPGETKSAGLYTKAGDVWSSAEVKAAVPGISFKAMLENADNINGKEIGIDLRPNRKKIATTEAQISKLEKELAAIKL